MSSGKRKIKIMVLHCDTEKQRTKYRPLTSIFGITWIWNYSSSIILVILSNIFNLPLNLKLFIRIYILRILAMYEAENSKNCNSYQGPFELNAWKRTVYVRGGLMYYCKLHCSGIRTIS